MPAPLRPQAAALRQQQRKPRDCLSIVGNTNRTPPHLRGTVRSWRRPVVALVSQPSQWPCILTAVVVIECSTSGMFKSSRCNSPPFRVPSLAISCSPHQSGPSHPCPAPAPLSRSCPLPDSVLAGPEVCTHKPIPKATGAQPQQDCLHGASVHCRGSTM